MFSILIDSVERADIIDFQSLKIRNRINNRIDECSFRIKRSASSTYEPQLGKEIVVDKDGTKLFGGVIVRVDEQAQGGNTVTYNVKATDYSQYLRRQIVIERYEDTTVGAIVEDLIDNHTDDGFTTNNVAYAKSVTSFSFNGLTVAECLDKLAKSTNALWYVDYNKDIHFFKRNEETTPFDLTDTSNNYIFNSLSITEDITSLRNRVTVRGGTTESATDRTETLVSQDGTQDVFPLGYKFAKLPVVKVNDVAVTVGTEYLSDDALVDCQWSFTEKYIRFTAGNIPSVTDVITVDGKILIPIIVRTPNNSSIAEFGVWEYQIEDKSIKSNDEAIERAVAELSSYSNELHEGSFSTYTAGLRSGQRLNIQSDVRGKDIDVIIQDVSLEFIDPIANQIRYSVSFATVKTLGIIEYLQQSLIDEEITEDAQETLLNFIQQPVEEFSFSDDGEQDVDMTSPPYVYADDAGNVGVWNFSTFV